MQSGTRDFSQIIMWAECVAHLHISVRETTEHGVLALKVAAEVFIILRSPKLHIDVGQQWDPLIINMNMSGKYIR